MFESYYELNDNPFRLSADESFRFAHKNYLKAWSYLSYALEQGEGFVMITGQPGCGKTTLIRDILAQLDQEKTLAINLVTNQLQAEELLRKVALEYGLPAESYNKATLLTHIQDFVEKEYQKGRRAIIVIDEAQNLTLNGLEELRLLSNLQSGSHPLFQIFLVGQDELRGVVLSPQMEHVRQRLIATCQIEPMSVSQTEGYIEHRLGIVGWHGDPELESTIFPLIHYITKGIPRKVNHVASRLLLYGALEEKHKFTDEDIWIVAEELFGEERLALKSGESFDEFKAAYSVEYEAHISDLEGSDSESAIDQSAEEEGSQVESDEEISLSLENDSFEPDLDQPMLVEEDAGLSTEQQGETEESAGYKEEDTDQLAAKSEIYIDSDEVKTLTEKIVDENRSVADGFAIEAQSDVTLPESDLDDTVRRTKSDDESTEAIALNPEEILNTPTMKAERYRHEIEASGGFIVTDDNTDKDDVLSGGILKSIRHVALIVLIGIPLIAYIVWTPEQINGFLSEANHTIQSFLTPKSQPYKNRPQPKVEESIATAAGNRTDSAGQSQSDESPTSVTDGDTLEAAAVVVDSVPETSDIATSETKEAGEDYIATQTRYQQIEVPDNQPPPIASSVSERKFQVFFEDNNAEIPTEFEEMLNDLYIVLSLNSQANLKIRGYTYPSDDPLQNMRLSLERAQKVSLYFIDRGIDQARIKIEGHSPTLQQANRDKDLLEKHLSSRRVELLLQEGLY
ncbi:MAG: AAA family ATPase [Candidatus Thiodiazotropha sp. (ex. Lucinisca nassula)]|nr:AAA family ATPase [Candidatus Thiodiazotropha sp. (ex. Lucinisca nassula)]